MENVKPGKLPPKWWDGKTVSCELCGATGDLTIEDTQDLYHYVEDGYKIIYAHCITPKCKGNMEVRERLGIDEYDDDSWE